MVNRRPNIQKGRITQHGVSKGGLGEGIIELLEESIVGSGVPGDELFLWIALGGFHLDLLGRVINESLPPRSKPTVTRISPVYLPDDAAGFADRIIVILVHLLHIYPVLSPADFFQDIVDAEVVAVVGSAEIQGSPCGIDEDFRHPVAGCIPAYGIAQGKGEGIVNEGGVKGKGRMEDPVGFRRHPQQAIPPLGIIVVIPGFQVEVELGIPQRGGSPFIDHGAAGESRGIGKPGQVIRHGGLPQPHEGRLVALVRRGGRQEIADDYDRHHGAERNGIGIEEKISLGGGLAREFSRGKDPGPDHLGSGDGNRDSVFQFQSRADRAGRDSAVNGVKNLRRRIGIRLRQGKCQGG